MNKLVGVLAVSTLAFAGATFYLANEVRKEEQRAAQRFLRATIALPARQSPSPQFPNPDGANPGATRGLRSSAPASAGAKSERTLSRAEQEVQLQAQIRAMRAQQGAKLLKQYEDPGEREKLLADERAGQRQLLGRFPQMLRLTVEETDRLLDVLAQLRIESRLDVARCAVEPACTGSHDISDAPLDREETKTRIAAVLGADTARRYDTFQNSVQERSMVTSVRARLDDGLMLRDEDAERLIEALADERDKYAKELERGGGRIYRTSVGGFPVLAREGEAKQQVPEIAEAIALGRRQRERAVQILSAEQMRVFDEMQGDVISMVRERHRSLAKIEMYRSLATSEGGAQK